MSILQRLYGDQPVLRHRVASGTAGRALRFARPYRKALLLLIVIIIIDTLVASSVPLIFRAIIDNGILKHDNSLIVILACAIALATLIEQALLVAASLVSSRIGQGLIFDLRSTVYKHIQRMPLAFFTRTQTGALMSRLDNDVIGAQQAFSDLLAVVVGNAFSIIVVLAVMFTLSWQITLVALIALPLGVVLARFASQRVAGFAKANYQFLAQLSTHMSERFNVAGALLVTLLGRPKKEAEDFDRASAQVRDLGVKMAVYSRLFSSALLVMAGLITALIFGWGGVLVTSGTLQLGTVVALATYLGRLYGPLVSLGNVPVDVMSALVSFERLFEILDVPEGVSEKQEALPIPSGPVRVVVEHVNFTYPGRSGVSIASLEPDSAQEDFSSSPILADVSFVMEPGQRVALIGHTGAGKTTISYLIRRLYDVTAGRISINGLDVRDATFASLQETIGMVTQDVHLFHETIRENLIYASPGASEEELLEVLESAQLHEMIDRLPEGLDTVVGDRGFRLSGGERQRFALARLMLQSPSVVILDEATSHLDSATEEKVQRALRIALAGRTALIIAHRLSTIREADQVLVLDHGRIVERGLHDELMATRGKYYELSQAQFGALP